MQSRVRLANHQRTCLIIGDSVSIGYTPMVANMTADLCDVVHAPFSGDGGACDSSYALKCLPLWLNQTLEGDVPTYAAVLYNFGLHDTNDKQDDFEARDEFVPLADIERLRERVAGGGPPAEVVVYPGCGHAFMNDTRADAFRPDAAERAWERMLGFFREHLG